MGAGFTLAGYDRPHNQDLRLNLPKKLVSEYDTILRAARRNDCEGEDFVILLAIRMAEAGRAGREFGVLHPRAIDTDLDTQAGWAAATVVKNRARWIAAGRQGEYIDFLWNRYCPPTAHPLNTHWGPNVKYWIARIEGE